MKTSRPDIRDQPPSPYLFSLRLIALTTTSIVIGVAIGALTFGATRGDFWTSALSGVTTAGLAFSRLHHWTEP